MPDVMEEKAAGRGRPQRAFFTYTKSVSPLSSATGWKTRLRRRIPSRQTVSSVLANTFPKREKKIVLVSYSITSTGANYLFSLENKCRSKSLGGFLILFSLKWTVMVELVL